MTLRRTLVDPRRAPMRLRSGTVAAMLVCGLGASHAQTPFQPAPSEPRRSGEMPMSGMPGMPLAPLTVAPAAIVNGPVNSAAAAAPLPAFGASAPTAPDTRTLFVQAEVSTFGRATDRSSLDASPARSDTVLTVSPRLTLRSRGAQVRFNATVGLDSVTYVKNTNSDFVQPVVAADVQTTLVDNLLFFDASADVQRRAASPYAAQSASVSTDNQLKTGIYRLSPRLEHHTPSGWDSLLRSDHVWTRQSGAAVGTVGQAGSSYSQNSQARFERRPEPFGVGVEGSVEELKYEDAPDEVLRLESARASVGYALTQQLTTWIVGGIERNSFGGRTESDPDYGLRLRWAPLERSVLTAEARKRFFGTGFNVQWDHRHRFFGLTLGAIREPNTSADSVQLAGNLGAQFDSIYRARGYSAAQREALVRAALNAYGLPANLTDPVSLRVNRPQLGTTGTALASFMGRRSLLVLSAFYRKQVQLRRTEDPVAALGAGDSRQIGGQASFDFRLTPLSSLDALYRVDDTRGIGIDTRTSREQVFSVGSNHWLSPNARVNLMLQHHILDVTDLGGPFSVSANSASVGLYYRF